MANYSGIYDYYRRFEKGWQHQQMATHYRQTIADMLKEIRNRITSTGSTMKITNCEKDFFRSNPTLLYNARGNRTRAENTAEELFPNCDLRNDIGDAFRHAYFAALNTHNMGYTNAKTLGDAHECDTPANLLNEKIMDLHNNSWGYNYSLSHLNLSETQFFQDFVIANNNGKIKTLENCN